MPSGAGVAGERGLMLHCGVVSGDSPQMEKKERTFWVPRQFSSLVIISDRWWGRD